MGTEHAVLCGAQIFLTVIVAPLGTFAIAANAFAITAESLCYMPGYGIADEMLRSLERTQAYHIISTAVTVSASTVPSAAPSTPRPAPGIDILTRRRVRHKRRSAAMARGRR